MPRDSGLWVACYGTGLLNNVLPFGPFGWGHHRISSKMSAILNTATALFIVLVAYARILADSEQTWVTWADMSGD